MRSRQNSTFLKDSEFIELQLKITGRIKDLFILANRVRKELSKANPTVVHINTGSISITACCVFAAKQAHVPYVISHSHNADPRWNRFGNRLRKKIKNYANALLRKYIKQKSDVLLACSNEAAEYLFGTEVFTSEKYHQINNAICVDDYLYNPNVRQSIRKGFKISDSTIVLAGVGRLSHQKNPIFLLEVFRAFHELYQDSLLWIIGDGVLKAEVQKRIIELNLADSVVLFGQRKDVNQLMQAMDIVVLPSLYEGLGIVSIEAQCAGLQVYLSDECSHGSDITDLIHFIPLGKGPQQWALDIKNNWDQRENRKYMRDEISEKGYNIVDESRRFERIYYNLVDSEKA